MSIWFVCVCVYLDEFPSSHQYIAEKQLIRCLENYVRYTNVRMCEKLLKKLKERVIQWPCNVYMYICVHMLTANQPTNNAHHTYFHVQTPDIVVVQDPAKIKRDIRRLSATSYTYVEHIYECTLCVYAFQTLFLPVHWWWIKKYTCIFFSRLVFNDNSMFISVLFNIDLIVHHHIQFQFGT